MPLRDSGRRIASDLMKSRSRIEGPTRRKGYLLFTIFVLFMYFIHNMSHHFLHSIAPCWGCANLWTRPFLKALVGDEGANFATHDSNDGACSSDTTFPCLAPSFA